MPARARPTSPHWTIYRWEMGNSLSILSRISGVILALGLLALTYWWTALAAGPEAYQGALRTLGGMLGRLVLGGVSLSFWYHLLSGVRHLFWDAGRGFERTSRRAGGALAVCGSVVLTGAFWLIVFWHRS